MVDNTMRDAAYAIRAFIRAPMASATIVLTVAIGLGLIGALFTVNMMLFRIDCVPDINETFAIERPPARRSTVDHRSDAVAPAGTQRVV